ncbi:MAG: thiol reductant ABC exporter subunit CydD [Lactobacillaceae bacterium]|jgi:ATP-binding cassette subfamily C protein CydD|nr:thiol reductant ABC exporter subunit CydD [Lactobacillaceae bacterium]
MFDKRIFQLSQINIVMLKLAVLSILQAFAIVIQTIFISKAIVEFWLIYKQDPISKNVYSWLAIFILVSVIKHLITYFKNIVANDFAFNSSDLLRQQLAQKFVDYGDSSVLFLGSGHAISLLNTGVDKIRNFFQLIFIKVIDLSIIPWIVLVYIFYLDWKLGLFLLLIFPVIIIFFIILGYAAQSKADNEFENFKNLNNEFADSLNGLQTLKQLGLAKTFSKQIFDTSEKYRKSVISTLKVAITSTFALDFFTTLSIAIVAVFLGFKLLNGEISLTSALIILILAPEYFLPLRNFADDYHATLDGKNAFSELANVLENKKNNLSLTKIPEINKKSEISIQDYSFSYDENNGIKNINLAFKGYKKIGLIGLSGSGKTTMLNNIAGILNGNGKIKINEIELNNFANQNWQKNLFYIPQQPFLFKGTIKENLSFTKGNILDALKKAGVSKELQDLNFEISEFAENISGGEAQRISIARAFLADDRKILLLDEPTAHLDLATELEIKKTLLQLFKNKIVFFATHRLHWVNNFDYLLIFKDGQVIEQGEPTLLKKKKNSYLNQLIKGEQ